MLGSLEDGIKFACNNNSKCPSVRVLLHVVGFRTQLVIYNLCVPTEKEAKEKEEKPHFYDKEED